APLVFVALMLTVVGLHRFVAMPATTSDRLRQCLEAAIILVGSALVFWELVVARDLAGEIEWAKSSLVEPGEYVVAAAKALRETPYEPTKVADVFTVQEEIARSAIQALDLRLPRGMETFRIRTRPTDLEAYDLYLRGRHAWRGRSKEGLELAVNFFRKAIAREANFAEAYAGLADAYVLLALRRYRSREETVPRAREAAERALALEPGLAEAYATRGLIASRAGHAWDSAEADLRRAIDLNPSYASAHHWYGGMLTSVGRLEEALHEYRRAIELDPLAPSVQGAFALALWVHGDLAQAEEAARRSHELAPELFGPLSELSKVYEAQGRGADALQAAEQAVALAPQNPIAQGHLARAVALFDDREKALEIVARLEADPDPCAPCIAEAYVALGEVERALDWLEAAIPQGFEGFYLPKVDPLYASLRDDPRFTRFLIEMGLE
ncbi:MAG: tetratricopeptide repeat protein, partial [Gemmatimonadetes bacterium]|nr:tetratricopeptide repeat protein [Gemmatimonadota bacterium]